MKSGYLRSHLQHLNTRKTIDSHEYCQLACLRRCGFMHLLQHERTLLCLMMGDGGWGELHVKEH